MKKYIKPVVAITEINTDLHVLAGSGGVNNGDSVGNSYTYTDVTYSRKSNNVWGDDDE